MNSHSPNSTAVNQSNVQNAGLYLEAGKFKFSIRTYYYLTFMKLPDVFYHDCFTYIGSQLFTQIVVFSDDFILAMAQRRAKHALPSGRLDAFVDIGNPMKGTNLFPYLRRRTDGRALKAVAPAPELELCRTVCASARPARWPYEVRGVRVIT